MSDLRLSPCEFTKRESLDVALKPKKVPASCRQSGLVSLKLCVGGRRRATLKWKELEFVNKAQASTLPLSPCDDDNDVSFGYEHVLSEVTSR